MNSVDAQNRILAAIVAERDRQDEKWGEQNHIAATWGCIIAEEAGEVCKVINEYGFNPSKDRIRDVFVESVQTAACCVALCESILRNSRGGMDELLKDLGYDPTKAYEIPSDAGEAARMSMESFIERQKEHEHD